MALRPSIAVGGINRINSDGTILSIANSQVLNAVVGPVPPKPVENVADGTGDGKSLAPGGPAQQGPRPPGPA